MKIDRERYEVTSYRGTVSLRELLTALCGSRDEDTYTLGLMGLSDEASGHTVSADNEMLTITFQVKKSTPVEPQPTVATAAKVEFVFGGIPHAVKPDVDNAQLEALVASEKSPHVQPMRDWLKANGYPVPFGKDDEGRGPKVRCREMLGAIYRGDYDKGGADKAFGPLTWPEASAPSNEQLPPDRCCGTCRWQAPDGYCLNLHTPVDTAEQGTHCPAWVP
jgi:hypothetical protein